MSDATVQVRTGSGGTFGLEVWALGTPAELDALQAAIGAVGAVRWAGTGGTADRRDRLTGGDAGRWRAYLRVQIRQSHPAGGGAS